MGKRFHGPFRIADPVDFEVGRDGDVFVTFSDRDMNVLGVILDQSVFRDLSDRLQNVVFPVLKCDASHSVCSNLIPGE